MKALVTGASRGIGEKIAMALAHVGYDLYLSCDRTFDVLEAVCDRIRKEENVSVTPIQADMSDENQVKAMFEKIGDIDLLVNNAGISHIGLLQDMSMEEWHRVMQVNVDSVFLCCRAALPGMIRVHAGCIINISSIWGNAGASMEVAYSTSKGAVNAFTKALAKEVAPSGVRVNAIACGIIDTDMNKCFEEDELRSFTESVPMDRMGTADEVAKFVVMLSSAPEYLTGQIITIDGGYL